MFTRGALAKAAGIKGETVRFYENRGLLAEPERNDAGYRLYSEEDVQKLRFIRRAKDLGFSLKEVAELLELRVSPRGGCAGVREQAMEKIEQIEAKLRDLKRMKAGLVKLARACEERSPTGPCPIIESLDGR